MFIPGRIEMITNNIIASHVFQQISMNVRPSKMLVTTSVSTQKGLIIVVVAQDIPWKMTIKPVEVTSFLSLSHLFETSHDREQTFHFLRVVENLSSRLLLCFATLKRGIVGRKR